VISEAEIEEKDNKNHRRVVKCGMTLFFLLFMVVVTSLAIFAPRKTRDIRRVGSENSTAPSGAPSASPTTATFVELLETLKPLYPSKKMFDKVFSDFETPVQSSNLGIDRWKPRWWH